MNKINKYVLIGIILLIIVMQYVSADQCIIRGFIDYKDGEAIDKGTTVLIHYPYYEFTYETKSGIDWPYDNYYAYFFTCRQNSDYITIEVFDETQDVYLTKGANEYNFTLSYNKPEIEIIPEEKEIIDKKLQTDKKEGGSSAGGSSGGGSTTTKYGLPISKISVEEGNELIIIYDEDWINLSKYIIKAVKIKSDLVKFILMPGNKKLNYDVGEIKNIDLNNDNKPDIKMKLDKIEDNKAYVSLEKIIITPPEIEKPESINNNTQDAIKNSDNKKNEIISKSNKLNILFIVLIILSLCLLYYQKKIYDSRKNEDE